MANNKGIKSLWGYPLIDSKGRHAIDDVRSNLENNFQKKNDDTLTTTSKTISGAINEVNAQYKDIVKQINDEGLYINAKYPPSPLVGINEEDEDITLKLQAMIDSLAMIKSDPLTRNGIIYIPTGKYHMGKNGTPLIVPMGVSIEGDGEASMYASSSDRRCGTKIFVTLETTLQCAIRFKGKTLNGFGGHLKGVNFSGGNGITDTTCVELDGTFAFSIRECSFEHLNVTNAIACLGAQNNLLSVSNCKFNIIGDGGDNASAGYSYGTAINFSNCADSDIMNNFIECCGSDGIVVGSNDCKIMGNFIDLNKVGVSVGGSRCFISNNTIKLNRLSGIYVNSSRPSTGTIISNNILDSNTNKGSTSVEPPRDNAYYNIFLGYTNNTIVMNNVINCNKNGGGIYNQSENEGNIIKDNIIRTVKEGYKEIVDMGGTGIIQRYLFEKTCGIWVGTQEEYDIITTKYDDVLYIIKQ